MWGQRGAKEKMMRDYSEIDKLARLDKKSALNLALDWSTSDPENSKAWSKLAYVYEINHHFDKAVDAANTALKLKPNYPPYLFKRGSVQFRAGNTNDAVVSFKQCVKSSMQLGDGYYLDSAKVAQAYCMYKIGKYADAAKVIKPLKHDAGVWLGERLTAEKVMELISKKLRKPNVPSF